MNSAHLARLLKLLFCRAHAVTEPVDLSLLVVNGLLDLVEQVMVADIGLEGGVASLADVFPQRENVALDGAA